MGDPERGNGGGKTGTKPASPYAPSSLGTPSALGLGQPLDLVDTSSLTWRVAPVGEGTAAEKPLVEKILLTIDESVIGPLTWDAFVRRYFYDPAAKAISAQGEGFVTKGIMTPAEAMEWVNNERNALLISVRDGPNSPLGKSISEWLKPRNRLPTAQDLFEKMRARNPGMSSEEAMMGVIKGSGRTRVSVNRIGATFRVLGPAMIAVDVVVSVHTVFSVPPEQRGRTAAREAGRISGGVVGGWAGATAGCEAGAAVGVWFEGVGAIPGCAVGAILGGFGIGYMGSSVGESAGEEVYEWLSATFEWE